LIFDGARWEMIPTYLLGLWGLLLAWRDFRRHGGEAVAPAVRSRALMGAVVAVGGLIALLLPAWLFPRVVFPTPSGYYPVGRIEAFRVDSSRDEVLTPESGDKRSLLLSIWYPADTSNGRRAPYHPNASTLASDWLGSSHLPGFLISTLTRARTHETLNAPFN